MTLPTLSLLYYRGQEGLRGLRLRRDQCLLRPNTPNLTRDLTAHLSLCFYWLFPTRGVNLLKLLDFFEKEEPNKNKRLAILVIFSNFSVDTGRDICYNKETGEAVGRLRSDFGPPIVL